MDETSTRTPAKAKPPLDIERELDAVVGRYEPGRGQRFFVRYGRWVARAVLVACAAVAMAFAIAGILDRNMSEAQRDAARKRPVTVDLLPPPK